VRILLGLHAFAGFAGTESYTLTVAEELAQLGHEVVVAAHETGPIADVARERGIAVVRGSGGLPGACDAVLAQDAPSALTLAAAYPAARRLHVVHSDYFALQGPSQTAGAADGVVVLNDRVRRFVEAQAAHPPITRLRQPVDLKRFGVGGGMRERARTALVLGNYLRGPALDTVVGACRDAGLEPVVRGIHTAPETAVEHAIADADLVIGLGRCVVEAMAGRRAAYVYGLGGGDGWVTAARYAALEADGFGGTATGDVIDGARLRAELSAWEPGMGAVNRQLAEAHDAARHAQELVAALEAVGTPSAPPADAEELARLTRLEWRSWSRYVGAVDGQRALRERLAALEEQAERLRRERDAALAAGREAQERCAALDDARALAERQRAEALDALAAREAGLAALRATRRYRLAGRLAAPLDRLRGRRS